MTRHLAWHSLSKSCIFGVALLFAMRPPLSASAWFAARTGALPCFARPSVAHICKGAGLVRTRCLPVFQLKVAAEPAR